LKLSHAGALEIESREKALLEHLSQSSRLLEQVPSLVQTVGNLEDKVKANGTNQILRLKTEGKLIGIDVDRHNGNLEWEGFARTGVTFAFIKATQGATIVDPQFKRNWQQAKDAKILRGAYHFLTGEDAARQAENFVQTIRQEPGDLPPVADFEANVMGPSATLEGLKTFLKIVEQKTNCIPTIYSGSYIKSLLSGTPEPELGKYPLWLAQYSPSPVTPLPWKSWVFWQFTDGLSIKGLPALNVNAFSGTAADLRTFAERSCTTR
jgi:lysozyme